MCNMRAERQQDEHKKQQLLVGTYNSSSVTDLLRTGSQDGPAHLPINWVVREVVMLN